VIVTLVVTGLLLGGGLSIGGGLAPASAAPEDPISPQPTQSAEAPSGTSPGQAVPSQAAPSDAAPSESAPSEPAPAPTDDAPAPGPPQTTDPGSVTPPPATAPVIQSPADGQLVSAPLTIAGTGTPGGSVQILAGGSSEPVCIVTPDGGGAWSCEAGALESSSSTSIRAVEITAGGNLADSISVRVLNAPTVTGGPRGSLTNAVVQGRAYPGATVTAVASAFSCSGTADASGAWSCPLAGGITDGDYTVTATQATAWSDGAASPASASTAIQVDVTVPAAPVLLEPRAGTALPASGAVFRGTGESGATVSVFAGAYSLCQVVVSGGSWSCAAAAIPAGSYNVAVLQQDPAGNVSVQSGALSLTFQDAATNAPGTPTGTAPPTTAPASPSAPAPGSPSSPSGPGAGSGSGTGTGPAPGAEGAAPSSPSTPEQGGGAVPPGAAATPPGTWTDATRFTAALQPVVGAGVATVWWIALVLGALALVLIALPARLLSSTVSTVAGREEAASGRGTAGRVLAGLLGRNRSRHEFDRAPEVRISPLVSAGATLFGAAAIVTLSSPVQTQPAYLRLFIAVAAALALVNLMATVVPSFVAKAAFGVVSSARVRPGLLLVSAAAAFVSRLADLDPVLVFGLVTGLVLAGAGAGRRVERGKLATVQVLGLLLLGAVAWLVSGAVGVATGSPDVWGSAAAEFLHVVVLASFGASSMLLVPFGGSAGRRILDWSPATWTLLAIASFTALSVLFVPAIVEAAGTGEGTGGVLVPLIGGIAFAAVCLSAWAWVRFVAADDDRP
jgi:hypothetical protein